MIPSVADGAGSPSTTDLRESGREHGFESAAPTLSLASAELFGDERVRSL